MASKQRNSRSGQLLIESAIALTVLILALTGLFALSNQALGLTRVIAERYVAANLAGEGIELIKSVAERNVLQGIAWDTGLQDTDPSEENCFYEMDYNESDPILNDGCSGGPNLHFLRFNDDEGDPGYGFYSYDKGKETRFTRRIEIELKDAENANDIMHISSIVRWMRRGGVEEDAKVEAEYFYWQQF